MCKENENIVTERLTIRNVVQEDAAAIYEIWSNPNNQKYMGDPVSSLDEVIEICKNKEENHQFKDGLLRVAVLKESQEIIGTCCFGAWEEPDRWGCGYSIKENCWHQGFATEILKGILDFARECNVKIFEASCAHENEASGHVLRKCGLIFDHKSTFKQPMLNVVYEEDNYVLYI